MVVLLPLWQSYDQPPSFWAIPPPLLAPFFGKFMGRWPWNMDQGQKWLHMTHLFLVVITCTKYEKDPYSWRKVMEQAPFHMQMDGGMERRRDGWTAGWTDRWMDKVKPVYPPPSTSLEWGLRTDCITTTSETEMYSICLFKSWYYTTINYCSSANEVILRNIYKTFQYLTTKYHKQCKYFMGCTGIMVSCQKGPTCHAYAWQIGPFWQDTLEICVASSWHYTVTDTLAIARH